MKYTREYLHESLVNGVCDVTFTKIDGTERVMRCTLDPAIVPQPVANPVVERKIKESRIEVMSVWVPELKAWRSFRIENVSGIDLAGT